MIVSAVSMVKDEALVYGGVDIPFFFGLAFASHGWLIYNMRVFTRLDMGYFTSSLAWQAQQKLLHACAS